MNEHFVSWFLVWNVIVFLLYGIDKWKAIGGKWRISEKTLICAAFCMGAVGAMAGMQIFHHKTRKHMFGALVGLALILNVGILILIERI